MLSIPFEFVLECLYSTSPVVKPMFGCHAVYIDKKIVFILRDRPLPAKAGYGLRRQVLPVTSDDFEESVVKACEFVLKGDFRIGEIPKPRYRKRNKIER